MAKRKTGLMYDEVFANYKVCDGYLVLSKEDTPWIEGVIITILRSVLRRHTICWLKVVCLQN